MAITDNRFLRYGLNLAVGGLLSTNTIQGLVARNAWSQAGAGTEVIVTGTSATVVDNVLLGGTAANPFTNTCTNTNFGSVSPGAVASVDVATSLATNAVNTGARIFLNQTAGTAKPVTVSQVAAGFRLTPAANFVGDETYRWEIRQ